MSHYTEFACFNKHYYETMEKVTKAIMKGKNILLRGGPATGKTTMMCQLSGLLKEKGYYLCTEFRLPSESDVETVDSSYHGRIRRLSPIRTSYDKNMCILNTKPWIACTVHKGSVSPLRMISRFFEVIDMHDMRYPGLDHGDFPSVPRYTMDTGVEYFSSPF